MARYTDPVCRQCRRIGEKLFLKGDRCYSPKCAVDRKKYPPGMHVNLRRRRPSDWGIQLQEKQKARFTYGVLERQFRRYFETARDRSGVTGEILLQLLEGRLDNVVFRLAFVDSRRQARQMVNHGHFSVNGKRVDIPSYQVKPDDTIAWHTKGESSHQEFVKTLTVNIPKRPVPDWLRLDTENLTGQILSLPETSDIDTGIDSRLIVEFYSR